MWTTGVSSNCYTGYSNTGPSLVAGNGPLTGVNCQPQGYGPMNRGSTPGVGGNSLVRENCPPHGYMPPGFGGDQSGMRQAEGDAWTMLQRTNSIRPDSGNPQYNGSQVLASSGTAQTAGVGTCRNEEQAVLLRRLGETESGRACFAQLKGASLVQEGWTPVLRRLVQAVDSEERGSNFT